MKFKVGDKVRVKNGLIGGNFYDEVYFGHCMAQLCGKIFFVEKVEEGGYYRLNDGMGCCWTESTLEPIISERLTIYREDNKTIAKYYKGDKVVTSVAKCAPEDEYSFETGVKLAMDRAIDKMKEEEIGYSWVKCVGYRQKNEFDFTVEKKYKIYENGEITCDDGYTFSSEDTREDMLRFLSKWYIFEEVK